MYTSAALLDIHERTQRCLLQLLDHCEGFSADQLAREIDGFGYGSLLLQLHHVIGAERYWMGVVGGELLVDEDDADRASIAALRAFQERTSAATVAYLETAHTDELNSRRSMETWGGKSVELMPAQIVLRTQTHAFQHKGQIAAMCRLLERPVPDGLDFPLR